MKSVPADVRRAAELLTTPEAREFNTPPLPRRALRGLLKRIAGGPPSNALAYPDEVRDLAEWLGMVACEEDAFDPAPRVFAMAAARMADTLDRETPNGELLELVRATATYFFRANVRVVAECLDDEETPAERRPKASSSNVVAFPGRPGGPKARGGPCGG